MTGCGPYNEERPRDSLGRVPSLTFWPRPNRQVGLVISAYLTGAYARYGRSWSSANSQEA
jgi:hypothetical protein